MGVRMQIRQIGDTIGASYFLILIIMVKDLNISKPKYY